MLLAARWRAHGVDVRLRTGVAHFRADASGRVSSILLTDGTELRADAVLVGVGVEAARELMPERPATHVHPAGDVVGPGHWTTAALDGAAGGAANPRLAAPAPQPPYVWSDQFGLRLQIVGSPEPDDVLAFDGDGSGDSFAVRYLDAAGSTRAALLANRPAEAADVRRGLTEQNASVGSVSVSRGRCSSCSRWERPRLPRSS